MHLETCPQFDEAIIRWKHFWNRQVYRRPVVMLETVKDGVDSDFPWEPIQVRRYYDAVHRHWDRRVAMLKRHVQRIDYLGDMVPMFSPDLGPDHGRLFG